VLEVKTIRQIGLIDLVSKISFRINDETKSCILSIENKWYSDIRPYQLEKFFELIRKIYTDEVIDLVLFCDYEKISESVILHCHNNKYKYLTVNDLKEFSGITFDNRTNNDLFDEYWLNF